MDFKPASEPIFRLGNIGNYNDADDIIPIGSATITVMNFVAIMSRMGWVGGNSLNTFFDMFGFEGILANASLVVIIFQIARFAYTMTYGGAGRPWSPFVFICFLLAVQALHDVIFYYGVINKIPSGNNEMIDAMKQYSKENGSRAVAGHATFLIFVGIVAMFLKERSLMFIIMTVVLTFYLLPYVITTFGPKTEVPVTVKPPEKPAKAQESKPPPAPSSLPDNSMWMDSYINYTQSR